MGGVTLVRLRPWDGVCICGSVISVSIGTEGAVMTHGVPFCADAGKVRTRDDAIAFVERCKVKAEERAEARERQRREGLIR